MINSFNASNANNREFKILTEFFKNLNDLSALRFLPSILKMLFILHKKFNRQIDRLYAAKTKLEDLLNKNEIFDERSIQSVETGAKDFLKAWSIIANSIAASRLELNNTSLKGPYGSLPLSFLLPNSFHDGRYIYSVVFYLINLQNEFLKSQKNNINQKSMQLNTEEVDIESVTQNDCIMFSIEKDLLQIVYMNSNYSYDCKEEINLEYDFKKIQITIEKRFLEDKSIISTEVYLIKTIFV